MLLTKIHIPLPRRNIVHRPLLINKLNNGLDCKLILLSAPAGYGKTTLLSDWIERFTIKIAWISLDSEENNPVNFLRYIISSVQTVKPDFGKSALELLESPNVLIIKCILNLLINDLIDTEDDLFLVFDDFHQIENSEVLELLVYLLDNTPNKLHIVISTRSDPQIPLSRLRSENQVLEIRAEELSFETSDISLLVNNKLKLNLSISDINALRNKTEGWIAGLQLAALSMQRNSNNSGFIEKLTSSNRFIMDYLLEEVLRTLPKDIEEFMLKTSILKQFSASLCDFVLERENSQLIIEKLEYSNMFVFPMDTERHWYRYHHLFADLLKQKLLNKYKSDIKDIHFKASSWYKKNGIEKLAIEHMLEINHFEKAIIILEDIIEELWKSGQHAAILKYGGSIPEKVITKSPVFCLYFSWVLIASGNIQQAQSLLLEAKSLLYNTDENLEISKHSLKQTMNLKGKISVALAYLYTLIAKPDAILENCKIARENLSNDDPLWYSWIWYTTGNARLFEEKYLEGTKDLSMALEYGKKSGNIYLISTIAIRLSFIKHRLGQYKESYRLCTDLLSYMELKGYSEIAKMDWTYAGLFSNMSMMQFMWADWDNALENIELAYNLCKNESNVLVKFVVLLGYSMVMQGRGDIESAMEKVYQIDELITSGYINPQQKSTFLAWKGYLLIELEELEQVHELFAENSLNPENEITFTNEHAFVAYLNMLLTENRINDAESLILKLTNLAESGNRIERLHELFILNAYLNKLTGNKKEAVQCLIKSMEYALPNDLVMYFILYLNKIEDLLEITYKEIATTKTNIPGEFIQKLKVSIDKRRLQKTKQESDLSQREIDILKLIAEGFTNQEISHKLFISLNTVKTHLKNINIKLDTDNRTKAAGIAKKLGLV